MNKKVIGAVLIAAVALVLGLSYVHSPDKTSIVAEVAAFEEVALGHDGLALVPETTTLPAGKNYKVTITPSSNGKGCMGTIKLPGIAESPKPILEGEAITYELEGLEPGEYTFVCNGMDMSQGRIVIEA